MKIIFEEFDSLGNYLKTIDARPVNKVFSGEDLSSKTGSYHFTETGSYEEATELARIGYRDGLDELKAASIKTKHVESAPKNIPKAAIVGFTPHVPNAITGVPLSMINVAPTEQKAKVISILYYMGGSWQVDTESYIEAGKNVLNAIHTLETQGYRVALNVMTAYCEPSERALNSVQIKNWRQPSNLLKLSYPLIHPSFFRRHGFRWLETQPQLTDTRFRRAYGSPLDNTVGSNTQARRKWLTDQGLLKTNQFYTERFEAEKCSTEQLIERMGINT